MESTLSQSCDERLKQIHQWIVYTLNVDPLMLTPLAGDASFRRYFRLICSDRSYIVMDAPPPTEIRSIPSFVKMANHIRSIGLHAPVIEAVNFEQGLMLLSDLGDDTYLKTVTQDTLDQSIEAVLMALSQFATSDASNLNLPAFDEAWLSREWQWHKEWFLEQWLQLPIPDLEACYLLLVASAMQQPRALMYRDFHSGNLMILPNAGQLSEQSVGLLDFQDAFIGPMTYDLASFLRDCYIDYPEETVSRWVVFYYDLLMNRGYLTSVSVAQFRQWFDWMGIQRHLKALMTFARKAMRDHDERYIQFIPRTLNYVITISDRYEVLKPLHDYYQNIVLPRVMEKMKSCVR